MLAVVVVLVVLLLLFGGLGFVLHALWNIAVIIAVVSLIVIAVRYLTRDRG